MKQAAANAKRDGRPRYAHKYGGVYWIEKEAPPRNPSLGHQGGDYVVVWPDGTHTAFDPDRGPPSAPPKQK